MLSTVVNKEYLQKQYNFIEPESSVHEHSYRLHAIDAEWGTITRCYTVNVMRGYTKDDLQHPRRVLQVKMPSRFRSLLVSGRADVGAKRHHN